MTFLRSPNKQQFLEAEKSNPTHSYFLHPRGFAKISGHYRAKLGITIVPAGSTDFAKALVIPRKQAIKMMWETPSLKYAKYITEHLDDTEASHDSDEFQKRHALIFGNSLLRAHYNEIAEKLRIFFDNGSSKIKPLLPEEVDELNEICKTLSCRKELDAAIQEWDAMKYFRLFCQLDFTYTNGKFHNPFLNNEEIVTALAKFFVFLDIDNKKVPVYLKKTITVKETFEFNAACSALSCRAIIDHAIEQSQIQEHKKQLSRVVLTKEEAIQEIYLIKNQLKPGGKAGYIFAESLTDVHCESLLITENNIINVLKYPRRNLRTKDMYLPDIVPFVKVIRGALSFPDLPQAGDVECGTLGTLYLKELLKDDARQLKDFTLCFSFYDDNKVKHFFLPSPQVLRYSQVSAYNAVLAAMLTPNRDNVLLAISNKNGSQLFEVKTLQKVLSDSIAIAKKQKNTALATQNETILASLTVFSERWLTAYQKAMAQRVQMQGEVNHYLTYRSKKIEKIVTGGTANAPAPPTEKANVKMTNSRHLFWLKTVAATVATAAIGLSLTNRF